MSDHLRQDEDHALILERIEALDQKVDDHIAKMHSSLLTQEEIERRDKEVLIELSKHRVESSLATEESHRQLDAIADVVLGEKRMNYDGEVERSGGMQELVAAYHNGGFRVHVPTWLKASVGSLIVAIGGIIAALITHIDL